MLDELIALLISRVKQMCTGIDENAVGACSELVFAPIDEMFPDDAVLLASGFRIIPLHSKTVELNCASFNLMPCTVPSPKLLSTSLSIKIFKIGKHLKREREIFQRPF